MKVHATCLLLSMAAASIALPEVRFEFDGFPDTVYTIPGETYHITGYATLTTTETDEAYQGWSLGMTADEGQIIHLGIDDLFVWIQSRTRPEPFKEFLTPCHFFCINKPSETDPHIPVKPGNPQDPDDPDRYGAVSSFVGLNYPVGTPPFAPNLVNRICRLTVEVTAPAMDTVQEVTIRYEDGFETPPVPNIYVVEGYSKAPDVFGTHTIRLISRPPRFIRGDVNADRRIDLADPIYALKYMFRDDDAPLCDMAMDANDDGRHDLSDGIFLLQYLFRDGPIPPPPFTECGTDPMEAYLTCRSFPPCDP